jgi:hypothetical protein
MLARLGARLAGHLPHGAGGRLLHLRTTATEPNSTAVATAPAPALHRRFGAGSSSSSSSESSGSESSSSSSSSSGDEESSVPPAGAPEASVAEDFQRRLAGACGVGRARAGPLGCVQGWTRAGPLGCVRGGTPRRGRSAGDGRSRTNVESGPRGGGGALGPCGGHAPGASPPPLALPARPTRPRARTVTPPPPPTCPLRSGSGPRRR